MDALYRPFRFWLCVSDDVERRCRVDERGELLVELSGNLRNAGILELLEERRGPVVLQHCPRALIGSNQQAQRSVEPAADLQLRHPGGRQGRSEEHTSELQSHSDLVCRLLLEKKKMKL